MTKTKFLPLAGIAVLAPLFLLQSPAQWAEEEEEALIEFFKRQRGFPPMGKPFPYPYDYRYARRLRSLPPPESLPPPKDGKNFSPLEAPPRSLEAVLRDIVRAWFERDLSLLKRHLHPRIRIACYYQGSYSHTLSADELLRYTRWAFERLRTLSFRFTKVWDGREGTFRASGVHIFLDPEGVRCRAAVEYHFVQRNGNWYIRRINYSPLRKRKKRRKICVLATVAFGPESREVEALEDFRDQVLSRTPLGRALIRAYYRLSPKLVPHLEGNERARRWLRSLLSPLVAWASSASCEEKSSRLRGPQLRAL